MPDDCSAITSTQSAKDITFPTGGLFGGITLVNVLAGEDYTQDAVALEQFATDSLWAIPGSILPNLTQADPQWTVFTSFVGGGTVSGTTVTGIDSVSAVLMHNNVLNEFVLDAPTLSQTSWVVTFPTKRYYYNEAAGQLCGASQVPCNQVQSLFQRNFVATGACDDVALVAWSREEQKPSTPGGFSPPPPSGAMPALCWEANVVTFNGKNVFGSANTSNVATAYEHGWMDLDLLGGLAMVAGGKHQLATAQRDVHRAAGHRLRRAVVQQRHADRCHRQADPVAVRRQLRAQVHAGTRQPAVSNTQQAAKHDWNGGAKWPRRFSLRCRNGCAWRRSKSAFCAAAASRSRPSPKVTAGSGNVTLGVSLVRRRRPFSPSFQGLGARYDNCIVTSSERMR